MSTSLSIECPRIRNGPRIPNGSRTLTVLAGIGLAGVCALAGYGYARSPGTPPHASALPATNAPAATERSVGTFTGSYENGLPVYRLPPAQITARRGSA